MNIDCKYVLTGLVAYLLGSINTAIIVSKFYIKSDVRQKGSGNAGMTNMLRNYGAKPAIITCAGDFLKGVIAILLARGVIYAMFGPAVFDPAYIAGICVLLGHIYPIYFGFRGGKGMVTTASVLLMINPLMFGIIMVIFLIIVLTSKIVSLGSILCCGYLSVYNLWRAYFAGQTRLAGKHFLRLFGGFAYFYAQGQY